MERENAERSGAKQKREWQNVHRVYEKSVIPRGHTGVPDKTRFRKRLIIVEGKKKLHGM